MIPDEIKKKFRDLMFEQLNQAETIQELRDIRDVFRLELSACFDIANKDLKIRHIEKQHETRSNNYAERTISYIGRVEREQERLLVEQETDLFIDRIISRQIY